MIAIVLSFVLNAAKVSNGSDETTPGDYFADAGDPRVEKNRPVSRSTEGRDRRPRR